MFIKEFTHLFLIISIKVFGSVFMIIEIIIVKKYKQHRKKMVFFAIPIIASLFTGLIGGVTLHFARRHHQENENNQQNNQNNQNLHSENESQRVHGIQLVNQVQKQEQRLQRQKQQQEQAFITKENEYQEALDGKSVQAEEQQKTQPYQFICPLSHKIMKVPAELMCGHCCQKQELIEFVRKNKKCPVCQKKSRLSQIGDAYEFKDALDNYREKRKARKLSKHRLMEDFGDDKFQLNFTGDHTQSDTQYELPIMQQSKLCSQKSIQN